MYIVLEERKKLHESETRVELCVSNPSLPPLSTLYAALKVITAKQNYKAASASRAT